jgi:Ribonuclease G/E
MTTEVLINAAPGETRLALVEDGRLVEYVNSRLGSQSLVGAIFVGRVASVSKALDAAFIELGLDRPGLLAFSDTKQGAPKLVEGAPVFVRVTRDATDDKGAKLTGRVDQELTADVKAPALIAAAPDPVTSFLATRVQPSWRVITDAPRAGAELRRAASPIFCEHDVDVQLEAALQPVVTLGDGASLVIEETAALVAIDVNTGPRGAPHAVNLAAVAEIARQLRLRNLAGQILIDFLPEKGRERRDQLVAALRVATVNDACEVHVLGLTRLGLAELTRRRVGESLAVRLGYKALAARSPERAAFDLLRGLDEQARSSGTRRFAPVISPAIDGLLKSGLSGVFEDLTRRHALQLTITVDATLAPGDFKL